jgi:hypothetical protein
MRSRLTNLVKCSALVRQMTGRLVNPKRLNMYIKSWPNTTSVWAGWIRFDIPVDRSDGA